MISQLINSILASLDIVFLYTSININEIVKIIETAIDNNPNFHQDIRFTLKSAINLISQNIVFVLNSKYFRQQSDGPIDNPFLNI